jgi:hypothetical protein
VKISDPKARSDDMSPRDPGRLIAMALAAALLAAAGMMPRARGQEAAPDRKEVKGRWFPLFGRHAGEYAVTRFTDLENHVRHKGREVSSGPHTIGGMGQIYHSEGVLTKRSDSPEDFR